MSTNKLPLPGNTLTMDDITDVISSSAVVRAMQKVNMDYEPAEKEKLDEIMTHPELLARVTGLIVTGKTDKEIAKVMDIKPFTVGFIRENEFVKALCAECFQDSVDRVKNGLSKITGDAITSLQSLVDPEKEVSEKVRYMAASTILQTVLKINGELNKPKDKTPQINNITQINNIQPVAKEAYDRAIRDMQSIIPVAKTIYEGEDNGEINTEPSK